MIAGSSAGTCQPTLMMGLRAAVRSLPRMLGMALLGLLLRRPHRWLPRDIRWCSADMASASLLYFGAALLRDCAIGDRPLGAVLEATAVTYAVLLLVSFAIWLPEFMLYLCIAAGIDLAAGLLTLVGLVAPDHAITPSMITAWELAAVFSAMFRMRLSRMPPQGAIL